MRIVRGIRSPEAESMALLGGLLLSGAFVGRGLIAPVVDDGLSAHDVGGAGRHAIQEVARRMNAPRTVFFHLVVDFLSFVEHQVDFCEFFGREFCHFQKLLDALETLFDFSKLGFDRFLPLLDLVIDRLLTAVAQPLVKRARCRTVAALSVARERVVARRSAAAGPNDINIGMTLLVERIGPEAFFASERISVCAVGSVLMR